LASQERLSCMELELCKKKLWYCGWKFHMILSVMGRENYTLA